MPDAEQGKPDGIGPPERPPAREAAGYSRTESPDPALQPPLRVRILAVSSAVLAWLVLRFDLTGDHSVNNILALIGMATAVATLLVWFLRNAAFPWAWRRGTIALLIVLLMSAVAVVRVDQVSGDLMPRFRFVWTVPPDARLELTSPTLPSDGISLATTTPDDFPQFLGPDRSGVLASVQLNPDWNAHPPRLVWKQPIGAGWSGFAAVNGFAVTLEQRGEQELVSCYRAETGELMWYDGIRARHESVLGGVGPRSTPTIHAGRVYALGATGVLRCLDGADGTLIWSRDLLAEFGVLPGTDHAAVAWGRAGSPLVVDSLVVVPAGGPREAPVSLVAYDRETGVEVWRSGSTQVSYSSPVLRKLGGVRQILSVNESNVSGHDVASGEILWSFPWPGSSTSSANTSQPIVIADSDGDSVFVSKGYGQGAARFQITYDPQRDRWNSTLLFESSRILKTKMTSAVRQGDYAYGLSDGILECVEIHTGSSLWKGGRYGHGQVLLVGNHLLVLTESGELVLVDATPTQHRELHRLPVLQGKTWNTLCLHGSLLLIRNGEEAAAYRLTLVAPSERTASFRFLRFR